MPKLAFLPDEFPRCFAASAFWNCLGGLPLAERIPSAVAAPFLLAFLLFLQTASKRNEDGAITPRLLQLQGVGPRSLSHLLAASLVSVRLSLIQSSELLKYGTRARPEPVKAGMARGWQAATSRSTPRSSSLLKVPSSNYGTARARLSHLSQVATHLTQAQQLTHLERLLLGEDYTRHS